MSRCRPAAPDRASCSAWACVWWAWVRRASSSPRAASCCCSARCAAAAAASSVVWRATSCSAPCARRRKACRPRAAARASARSAGWALSPAGMAGASSTQLACNSANKAPAVGSAAQSASASARLRGSRGARSVGAGASSASAPKRCWTLATRAAGCCMASSASTSRQRTGSRWASSSSRRAPSHQSCSHCAGSSAEPAARAAARPGAGRSTSTSQWACGRRCSQDSRVAGPLPGAWPSTSRSPLRPVHAARCHPGWRTALPPGPASLNPSSPSSQVHQRPPGVPMVRKTRSLMGESAVLGVSVGEPGCPATAATAAAPGRVGSGLPPRRHGRPALGGAAGRQGPAGG